MAYSFDSWLDDPNAPKASKKDAAPPAWTAAAGPAPVVGAAQPPASPTPADAGSGGKFVNFDRLVNANRTGAVGMANQMEAGTNAAGAHAQQGIAGLNSDQQYALAQAGGTGGRAQSVYGGGDAGYRSVRDDIKAVHANAGAATTQAGREGLLAKQNGAAGNYTRDQAGVDSALIGGVAGTRYQDNAKRWAGLDAQLTEDAARGETQVSQFNGERDQSDAQEAAAREAAAKGAAAAQVARGDAAVWEETKQAQFADVEEQARQEVAREGGDPYDPAAIQERVNVIRKRNNGRIGYLDAREEPDVFGAPSVTSPHL